MASIIPNYEYDIFISYRHKDNRQGGITEFVELLKKELEATFKEDLSIYFDSNANDGLLENHNVDKSLEGKLKCLIFIPIISQTYCDTKSFAWQHEFVAFNKLAQADSLGRDIKLSNGNVASRILPIRVHDLDAEDKALIETEIGGVVRAIEFIYKEPGVNRPLKVSDKKEDNQNHTDYTNQLNKVANAIKEIISAIKNPTAARVSDTTGHRQPITGNQSSSTRKILIGSLAFLLVAILGWFAYQQLLTNNQQRSANEQLIDKSIAVLPFVNMSDDAQQEYFSDGLSEELLNLLAKIPGLKVIARTSSFSFKGKNEDLRTIGQKLGVAHILEGSVRKSGNTLRITAQLIKVEDGSHLWSETYDRTLDDVFKVQDEISAAVVAQLKLKLLNTEVPHVQAAIPEAYNLWLEGKYFAGRRSKADYEKAIEKYKQALALDSTFAPAWRGLSFVYLGQASRGYVPVSEGMALARAAVNHALRLDPQLAEAYAAQSRIFSDFDWDWAAADAAIKKALALDPNNATVVRNAATQASTLGNLREAIALYKQAIVLDPLAVSTYFNLVLSYYYLGQYSEAEAAIRKVLELNPEYGAGYCYLAKIQLAQGKPEAALESVLKEKDEIWRLSGLSLVYHQLNRKAEADATLKTLIEKYSDVMAYQIAQTYAYRGERDKAFEWLERAYQQRDGGLSEILGDQILKNLWSDARWQPFLKKMKLDDESLSKIIGVKTP